MPVDEEAGNNVQEEKTPEIIDNDDCPVPFNSALYEVPDVTMRKVKGKKHVSEATSSQSSQQQNQRSAPSSTSSGHHQQSPAIIRRPPPPSMLIDPRGEDDEESASTNPAVAPQTSNR